jgi:Family of unknown function (DUF5317)
VRAHGAARKTLAVSDLLVSRAVSSEVASTEKRRSFAAACMPRARRGDRRCACADLSKLADLRLRHTWSVFTALALQIIDFSALVRFLPAGAVVPVHVGSYVFIAVFLVANLRVPGMPLLALGWLANLTAILINGGRMPISLRDWTMTGRAAPVDPNRRSQQQCPREPSVGHVAWGHLPAPTRCATPRRRSRRPLACLPVRADRSRVRDPAPFPRRRTRSTRHLRSRSRRSMGRNLRSPTPQASRVTQQKSTEGCARAPVHPVGLSVRFLRRRLAG